MLQVPHSNATPPSPQIHRPHFWSTLVCRRRVFGAWCLWEVIHKNVKLSTLLNIYICSSLAWPPPPPPPDGHARNRRCCSTTGLAPRLFVAWKGFHGSSPPAPLWEWELRFHGSSPPPVGMGVGLVSRVFEFAYFVGMLLQHRSF